MVMTLSALNLQTQECLGDGRGCKYRILFIDLHCQEVRRTVEVFHTGLRRTRCRYKLVHHIVVGTISCKTIAKILLHPFTIRKRPIFQTAISSNKNVRPNSRPIRCILFGIAVIFKKPVHQLVLAIWGLVFAKLLQLVIRRNSADNVQENSTTPF